MFKKLKKKNYISPVESVMAILTYVVVFSVLYLKPDIIAIYYKANGEMINIPIFNINILENFRVLIIFMLVISVLKESLKFVWKKWSLKNSSIYVVLTIIYNCLSIAFLSRMDIWNSEALEKLYEYIDIPFESILSVMIFIIIICVVMDILVFLFKGIRGEMLNKG